jgi:hypothetical protein
MKKLIAAVFAEHDNLAHGADFPEPADEKQPGIGFTGHLSRGGEG